MARASKDQLIPAFQQNREHSSSRGFWWRDKIFALWELRGNVYLIEKLLEKNWVSRRYSPWESIFVEGYFFSGETTCNLWSSAGECLVSGLITSGILNLD